MFHQPVLGSGGAKILKQHVKQIPGAAASLNSREKLRANQGMVQEAAHIMLKKPISGYNSDASQRYRTDKQRKAASAKRQ
jgi:hypothetical protein